MLQGAGSVWSFLPILGLSIVDIAPESFSLEIGSQLLGAQHPPQWSESLRAGADTLMEQEGYAAAVQHYRQLLMAYSNEPPSLAMADILFQIGYLHDRQTQLQQALTAYQQSLQILDTLSSFDATPRRAEMLVLVGWLFHDLGDFEQAKVFLEMSISSYRELLQSYTSSPRRFGDALYLLGRINDNLGNLVDALMLYEQAYDAFEFHRDISSQLRSAILVSGIYTELGDYEQAYQIADDILTVSQAHKSQQEEAEILILLGFIQRKRDQYESAIDYYQRALTSMNQVAPDNTALLLNNLGYAYLQLRETEQARISLNRALAQVVTADSQSAKAYHADILDTFGELYEVEQAYDLAWTHYTFSLRLSTSLEDKIGQIMTWINLAQLLSRQKQAVVAISLYKQAINDIEQVRDNLRSLPLETQQRYTETVADSYRELAALLLEQERVFEAQQVLDLLKIQELEDYLHDVRAERPQVDEKLPYLPPERILLEQHRVLLLEHQSDTDAVISLEAFLAHPDVAAALETLDQSDPSLLQPESLQQLQQKLQTLPHKSVVLYPLVLEDRLELLLVPPDGPPIHQTTQITKHQLTEQVSHLRHQLADPSSDVKTTASSLYESLIAPFQADLNRLKIQNIIYIPDSVLHYIPLAVLYDQTERQWLAEQYTSHNLTASDFGDLTQPPSRPFDVLAGAFADASQTFEKRINQRNTNFHGLTYAGHEVSFLQKKLPSTQILLDADFSRNNLETQFQGQNIIHLATHAAFVPGQPEDSFILLGDGDTITLKELRNLSLPNVDLVVLSACQTGISHIEDGLEILGMGFQVQRTDARAALASLWWVDDRSTSQLMELFYTELTAGATKVEALQKAQRHLIANGQDEPYYWAPFVLIGNGL